jgi:hypothetical protein
MDKEGGKKGQTDTDKNIKINKGQRLSMKESPRK